MNTLIKETAPLLPGASAARIFSMGFGPRIMHNPPDDGGTPDPDPEVAKGVAAALAAKAVADKIVADAAAAKTEADRLAAEEAAKNKGPSDDAAKLLKENMEKKATIKALQDQLKAFEGIDAAAARLAATAKADAEKAALLASGDFDRLKTMMADEHAKELKVVKDAAEAQNVLFGAAQKQINELTIGSSFSGSPFINDELVLTASKARVVYGSHFEIEDGKTVAYDKPAGETARTKLVDGAGNPLAFEFAIKKIVEADPDRDRLLKGKLAAGAGSKTDNAGKKEDDGTKGLTGTARIAASLAAKAAAKK